MLTRIAGSVFVALILLLPCSSYALPPIYMFQAGLGDRDIGPDDDSFYYLTGRALLSKELSYNSILDLEGEVSTYDYSDIDDLDGEELFLQATYAYTPRAGFQVPTYSVGLRLLDEYLDEDDLDATTFTLTLAAAYRINDRSSIRGGLKIGDRDAEQDSDPEGYFVNFDYQYATSWLIYTTLGYDEGVFNARSYCSGGYDYDGGGYGYGSGRWDSDSFMPDDCDETYLIVGTSFAVNAFNSFDISLSHREYDFPGGDADGEILSVDYFHRF